MLKAIGLYFDQSRRAICQYFKHFLAQTLFQIIIVLSGILYGNQSGVMMIKHYNIGNTKRSL
jgi:hypothetical protein